MPASLLQTPMMLMRLAADSMGPITVTKGLPAVCNTARPIPKRNSPAKNNAYWRVRAAGMKNSAPSAMM